MGKFYPLQNNFTAGEIDTVLQSRPELRGFKNGAESIKNFIVDSRGGVFRRGGFKKVCETKYKTTKVRIIPFIFNDTPSQSYVIELGNRYLRIVRDHALLTRDQSADALDYGYNWIDDPDTPSNQNDLNLNSLTGVTAELNFRIQIDGAAPDTFKWSVDGATSFVASTVSIPDTTDISLSDSSFDGTITINFDAITGHNLGDLWDTVIHPSTEPILMGTPYDEEDLDEIVFSQSADILWLTHKDYAPYQLRRKGAKDWEFIPHPFRQSPFEAQPTVSYRLFQYLSETLQRTVSGFQQAVLLSTHTDHLRSGNHSGRISWSNTGTINTDNVDEVPDYILDNLIDGERYLIEMDGYLDIEETGTYTFSIVTTGSAYFGIDNGKNFTTIISNVFRSNSSSSFNTAGDTTIGVHGSITFDKIGQFRFIVKYCDQKKAAGGTYGFALYWKKPSDSTYEIIPASNFTDREVKTSVSMATTELWDYAPTALDSSTNGELAANFSEGYPQNEAGMDFLFTTNDAYNIDSVVQAKMHGRIAWATADDFENVTGSRQPSPAPSYVPEHGNIGWKYEGWIYIPEDGDYYFSLDSNDSSDLAIKSGDTWSVYASWYGRHNINGDTTNGFQFDNASVTGYDTARSMAIGWHQIRVRLFSGGFHSAVGVAWSKPSDRADKYNAPTGENEWKIIPESALGTDKDNRNNPRLVSFYQNRLVYAASLKFPQRLWFSKVDNYDDFTEGVEDTDGFHIDIADDQVNGIQWLVSSRKLLAGTISSEHVISGHNGSITPENPEAVKQPGYGSDFVMPVTVEHVIIFVQRHGKILRELSYDFGVDGYRGRDDSILSDHLYTDGIREIYLQRSALCNLIDTHDISVIPINIVWVLTQTGYLRGITYELEQEVIAHHRHDPGGVENSNTSRYVESICVIPGRQSIAAVNVTGDELYIVNNRGDPTVKRYIEYLDTQSKVDGKDGDDPQTYESELKTLPIDFMLDEINGTVAVSKKQWGIVNLKFHKSAGLVTLEHGAVNSAQSLNMGSSIGTPFSEHEIYVLGIDDKGQLILKHTPIQTDGSDSYPVHLMALNGVAEFNAY